MRPRLDVVVPAHDEQALIGACLHAVLSDADQLDLRLIVVANGCSDATADTVREVASVAGPRVDLRLIETATTGKAAALNLADQHRRGCAVVHLDADTVLAPGTLPALAAALGATVDALLVMPRPLLVRPRQWLARQFVAVWSRLPAVAGQVFGSGCYAVNAAGRARWSVMPRLWADDAFVRSLFGPAERRVIPGSGVILPLPAGRELVRVVGRWRRGNAALALSPAAGAATNLRAVLSRPALWPHLPGFLLVSLAARRQRPARWPRSDRLRAQISGGYDRVPPRVTAIVLSGVAGGGATAARGPRSRWAELTVATGRRTPGGFVPDRPVPAGGDYLLVIGAGAEPAAGALDELLALALRFPAAGIYAGVPAGRPERWYAVAEVRRPATGLLLVSGWLWRRLPGPPHPAGADLVRAARLAGARPMCTFAARYSALSPAGR